MKKCYLVIEGFGGQWDYSERPVKVFSSEKSAEKFIKTNSVPPSSSIPQEAFMMALESISSEDITTPLPELIVGTGKYPEWSLEELRKAAEIYRRGEMGWIGYRIEELELCQ